MKIVHFAPFGPHQCGLYEAARDMVVADRDEGHEAELVDTGCFVAGRLTTEQGRAGLVDDRGGRRLATVPPEAAREADVLVCHTGVPDPWIAPCQAPIVWVLHGRPAACFRPEQFGGPKSYSLLASLAHWPRIRAMVSFWSEHRPFWEPIVPRDKLVVFDSPPIDAGRFTVDGPRCEFDTADFNVLVADTWREDVDCYEIVHGVLAAARAIPNIRLHLFAMEDAGPWLHLLAGLRAAGVLGTTSPRIKEIDRAYRAADLLLSPHRIAVRTIAECLLCGTPVLAADGCRFTPWTCDPSNPASVAEVLGRLAGLNLSPQSIRARAERDFSLARHGRQMSRVYERVLVAR